MRRARSPSALEGAGAARSTSGMFWACGVARQDVDVTKGSCSRHAAMQLGWASALACRPASVTGSVVAGTLSRWVLHLSAVRVSGGCHDTVALTARLWPPHEQCPSQARPGSKQGATGHATSDHCTKMEDPFVKNRASPGRRGPRTASRRHRRAGVIGPPDGPVRVVRPGVGVVHANVGDEVFLRVGDENRRLTFAQRQELTFDRGQDAYGARPTAALIGEAEGSPLADYMRATAAPDGNRLLHAHGLAGGQHLTVAGCLCFATIRRRGFPRRSCVCCATGAANAEAEHGSSSRPISASRADPARAHRRASRDRRAGAVSTGARRRRAVR